MPAMKSLYVLYVRSPTVLYVSMCTQMRGEQRLGVRTRQPTSSLSFSLFLFVYTVRPIRAYQRIIYSAGASLAAPTATRPDRPTDFRHGRPYIHLCFLPFFPSFFRPLFPRTALFPLFFPLFLFCSRRLFPLFFFDLCFFLLFVGFIWPALFLFRTFFFLCRINSRYAFHSPASGAKWRTIAVEIIRIDRIAEKLFRRIYIFSWMAVNRR